MSTKEHKKLSPKKVKVGIFTISTTRTIENDESGKWIKESLENINHEIVLHKIIKDDIDSIKNTVLEEINIKKNKLQVMILTGGTGISNKDVTIEAIRPLFEKELVAFGNLFATLSYNQIKSAAILSRATAGIIKDTVVFCIPGSLKACKLACESLIFPELGHLVKHLKEN